MENLKSSVADKGKVATAIESVGEYLTDAKVFEDNSLAKEYSEFQKSFEELLKESKIKKLVVLIDDLDRCLPKVTIETLEAVRLFMFSKSTAFVIAADETMIEYAVRNHFPDLPDDSDIKTGFEYSKRYLEKLMQVPFRIPALGEIESGMYITLLLIKLCFFRWFEAVLLQKTAGWLLDLGCIFGAAAAYRIVSLHLPSDWCFFEKS